MDKKGFEIQFNWIFILVAGSLILLFFTTLVVKQKNLSRESTNAAILRSFESIISGASVSIDTTNVIDLLESEIFARCGTISVGKASKQFQSLILFSPSLIKGNKIITQTFSLDVPYRASNLLMITSPNIKYNLIGNDPLIALINKSLPVDARKESFDSYVPSQIKTASAYRIKFISTSASFPGDFPAALSKMPDSDVSGVKITGNDESGRAQFYEKRGNSWVMSGESHYLGKGSLMGAIYSDFEIYNCSIHNAFLKSEAVSSVYLQRTSSLIGHDAECDTIYSSATPKINSIKSLKPQDSQAAITVIEDIRNLNKEAQRKSCPSIY